MFRLRLTEDSRLIWVMTQSDPLYSPALQLSCWSGITQLFRFPFCCGCRPTSRTEELFAQYATLFENTDSQSRNIQRIAHFLEQHIKDSETQEVAYQNISQSCIDPDG